VFGVLFKETRGDREANLPTLEQLYDKYAGVLMSHCLRILGERQDAEDALQETFCNAYRALASFHSESGHLPWLYRIATNVCISEIRRRRRKWAKPHEMSSFRADESSNPGRLVAAREVLNQLAAILDERDSIIIVEHYIGGMDQEQIAQSLGISRRAVAKRLRKLRDRIGLNWPEEREDG
jgi:RNA polymerase sigma-70 factor (ECF subfamily)